MRSCFSCGDFIFSFFLCELSEKLADLHDPSVASSTRGSEKPSFAVCLRVREMEATSSKPEFQAGSNAVKFYYTKRREMMALKRPAISRQMLANSVSGHAPPCGGQFQLGAFYEIDHASLPPKSPIQLKAIRVVKVSETTRLDVTVSFASVLSLRNYFAGDPDVGRNPELDERFVMGANQAVRILRRMVPEAKMDEEKHMECFWVVSSKALECPPPVLRPALKMPMEVVEDVKSPPVPGGCLLALKCAGVLAWGVRRKVKYIGRHRELPAIAMKKEEPMEVVEEKEKVVKKRFREETRKKENRFRRSERRERKKARECKEEKTIVKFEKGSKDRWSSERYQSAELKLLGIMREKGAMLGNPIPRQALREEARKHIGDTGLLDHLLKHMAGKIVSDGAERFRRRHNAEGAMEYWVEPADLVEVRREAGVMDPYWMPPPGWKLGDAIFPCPCGTECKSELRLLKDELATLKREMEQLNLQKQLELECRESQSEAEKSSANMHVGLESYESLLEWTTRVEGEMARMSASLQVLKEEMEKLKEEKEEKQKMMLALAGKGEKNGHGGDDKEGGGDDKEGGGGTGNGGGGDASTITTNNSNSNVTTTNNNSNVSNSTSPDSAAGNTGSNNNNNNSGSSNVAGSKRAAVRKSGFRICKPQGTFLWPNMASSLSPRAAGRCQGLPLFQAGCSLPTPPSASSATSAPSLPGLELAVVPYYGLGDVVRGSLASSSMMVGAAGKRRKVAASWSGVTTELALAPPSSSLF